MSEAKETPQGDNSRNTKGYRWAILALNTGVQVAHACVTTIVGVLAPFLVADLALTKAMVGLAGGAINFGMAFTALLAGRLADKKGERAVLVAGSIITGIAIIVTSRADSFSTLLPMLVLTGAGASSPTPAGSKSIQRWFPPAKLGFALGVRQTGIPLGGFIGALLLPVVAAEWGWRTAMVTSGLVTIAGGLVYFIFYREPPAGKACGLRTPKGFSAEWGFLRDGNMWLVILMSIIFLGAQFDMLTYLTLFLHDQAGLDIALASVCLAITQLGGVFARVALGIVSDTTFNGARKPALIILGTILIATALVLVFFSRATPLWAIVTVSWFFGVSAMGWNGLFVALVMKLAGKEHGGTAVGFCLMVMQIGVLVFPPLFGLLIDLSGSYRLSWLSLAGAALVGTLLISRVSEPRPDGGST